MLNLISNALRYTVEGGRILIGCRRRNDDVEIVRRRYRHRHDPDHLPSRLPGVLPCHADNAREWRRDWVSDLRLSSVFPTCSAIEWQSPPLHARARSCGSPVPRAEPEEEIDVPFASLSNSLAGVRVLVVDDEASARDAMEGMLLRWGCEVVTARDGSDAVEHARKRRPDVVLCDLSLNDGETGVHVVECLRRACGPTLVCAFITGESAPERIAEVRATGYPIAFKPTTAAKLRAVSSTSSTRTLLDHFIRLQHKSRRNSQAERASRWRTVDRQRILARLLDRQLGGIGPFQYLVDDEQHFRRPKNISALSGPYATSPPSRTKKGNSYTAGSRWRAASCRRRALPLHHRGAGHDDDRLAAGADQRIESRGELVGASRFDGVHGDAFGLGRSQERIDLRRVINPGGRSQRPYSFEVGDSLLAATRSTAARYRSARTSCRSCSRPDGRGSSQNRSLPGRRR